MKFIDKEYVIFKDKLKDKEHVTSYGDIDQVGDYFVFYFDELFANYNEKVYVSEEDFSKGINGDEYYIFFYKDKLMQKAVRIKDTNLSKRELKNVVSIKKLSKYLKIEPYVVEKNNIDNKVLSREVVIDDLFKSTNKTASIISAILLFVFAFLIIISLFTNFIEMSIVYLILMTILILLNAYSNRDKIRNIDSIKNNNFYIIKEKVSSVNCNIDFRNINVVKSFKMEDGRVVYGKLEDFYDTDKGDSLYIFYRDDGIKPAIMYDAKHYKLDDELKNKIKADI